MSKDITYAKKFASRLRTLAQSVGSQEELARRADVEPRRLQAAITRNANPGADLVAKVCQATGCSPRWLLFDQGPMFERIAENPPEYHVRQEADSVQMMASVTVARAADAAMRDVPLGAEMWIDVSKKGVSGQVVAACINDRIVARRILESPGGRLFVPDNRRLADPVREDLAHNIGLIIRVVSCPNPSNEPEGA